LTDGIRATSVIGAAEIPLLFRSERASRQRFQDSAVDQSIAANQKQKDKRERERASEREREREREKGRRDRYGTERVLEITAATVDD